ncbi:MAG: tRNA epoxyqueuosine(34) reductase QueG [Nitrospirae bacterium]|nr:tRNA epoxyqueuosine(34) reductase QueG [Nitrospirota bacterium]
MGLSRVGFARPDMAAAASRHRAWIEAGRHGEMAYLARRLDERADPALLLPGLATAIVATQHYAGPGDVAAELANPALGYVARYARGRGDYHDVLKARLAALMERVRAVAPDVDYRVYVDTGPLLEKPLANQAGVGWQGKHSNLIDPAGGNWFVLGVVLTTLDLPPDPPAPDHCGTCDDCMRTCPTGAITAPYQLDARRCVSYLTIELKGPIPRALRPLMGNRVFGCDDCLAACPWNRHAAAAAETAYAARAITGGAPLVELMALTPAEFSRYFKGTPLFRTRRRGLLRNVAVALGNWGAAEAVPVLKKALADDEALIRGHAAWALGRIGGEEAALATALPAEADPWVREELAAALLSTLPPLLQ